MPNSFRSPVARRSAAMATAAATRSPSPGTVATPAVRGGSTKTTRRTNRRAGRSQGGRFALSGSSPQALQTVDDFSGQASRSCDVDRVATLEVRDGGVRPRFDQELQGLDSLQPGRIK